MNKLLILALLTSISTSSLAKDFTLKSYDMTHGQFMSKTQEFKGFGCKGGNQSPQLYWSNTPKGTKSFAITAYDPDAPTGSGWWHWQIVNIPKDIHMLAAGTGSTDGKLAPKGSLQLTNDFGAKGFGGACPPKGDGAHRYQFTVFALAVEKLELPENASAALAGYMINANAIGSATLEALYTRNSSQPSIANEVD